MLGLLITFCLAVLWVSHRVHGAYVHTVSREERQSLRRAPASTGPHHHLGPKCFFVLDLMLITGVIAGLRELGFFTARADGSTLAVLIMCCVDFSALIALWLFLEGRHLQLFYQHMARAVRGLRGEARQLAWSDPLLGRSTSPLTKVSIFGAILWAAIPLVLNAFGIHLLDRASTPTSLVLLFVAYFVLPQVVLAVLFARAVLPLRRLAYS